MRSSVGSSLAARRRAEVERHTVHQRRVVGGRAPPSGRPTTNAPRARSAPPRSVRVAAVRGDLSKPLKLVAPSAAAGPRRRRRCAARLARPLTVAALDDRAAAALRSACPVAVLSRGRRRRGSSGRRAMALARAVADRLPSSAVWARCGLVSDARNERRPGWSAVSLIAITWPGRLENASRVKVVSPTL